MFAGYDALKFWLPIMSAFALAIKGFSSMRKSIDKWAENHLSHIQTATESTHIATLETNNLLKASAIKDVEIAGNVAQVKVDLRDHQQKEMQVWQGVVNTLAVLEDRTKRTPRRRR